MARRKKRIIAGFEDEVFPPGLEQDEGFLRAFDFLENSREHIFVTGEAGTGKSTLLRYFRSKTKKNVVVLAPTGVAAINVGGQTIHSFFRFPLHFVFRDDIKRLKNTELLENLDTLIIDEASMLRAEMMDAIDYALRLNRDRMREPFGGVQLVFFGDLHQLAPVLDPEMEEVYREKYLAPYFFHADIFTMVRPKYIELDRIYRQSDGEFIRLLRRIRNREAGRGDMGILNNRVRQLDFDSSEHIVTLTTRNDDAYRINERRLASLPGEEYRYQADVTGQFDVKSVIADETLKLKKGAQVMLLKNDPEKRWVNGTIARVFDLDHGAIKVLIGDEVHEVARGSWEKVKYTYNQAEQKIESEITGNFEQFPMKLAWAITIHKSQGQTFDEVHIDLGSGAFAHGQLYVALSRCRTLDGITLRRPVAGKDVIFDERIFGFREKFERVELWG